MNSRSSFGKVSPVQTARAPVPVSPYKSK
ncbi:hypothetical protein E2C01_101735 [Portunus trituberculatus]|uniref:Uncharacterized protein n=1 Tax=Portunus trituberculatus TaxID=210409 RepID=A0A5B7KFM1_PORTR|nr:hypothetical protein [Portunus trituberculatus]